LQGSIISVAGGAIRERTRGVTMPGLESELDFHNLHELMIPIPTPAKNRFSYCTGIDSKMDSIPIPNPEKTES